MALNGQMMDMPLTTGSLIDHAARYHSSTEIISVEADGSGRRSDWASVAVNACRLASALQRLGIGIGDRVGYRDPMEPMLSRIVVFADRTD